MNVLEFMEVPEWKFWNGSFGMEVLERKFWNGSSGIEVLEWKFWNGSSGMEVLEWKFSIGSSGMNVLEWKFWDVSFGMEVLEWKFWNGSSGMEVLESGHHQKKGLKTPLPNDTVVFKVDMVHMEKDIFSGELKGNPINIINAHLTEIFLPLMRVKKDWGRCTEEHKQFLLQNLERTVSNLSDPGGTSSSNKHAVSHFLLLWLVPSSGVATMVIDGSSSSFFCHPPSFFPVPPFSCLSS